jgi:hypothetical protein
VSRDGLQPFYLQELHPGNFIRHRSGRKADLSEDHDPAREPVEEISRPEMNEPALDGAFPAPIRASS